MQPEQQQAHREQAAALRFTRDNALLREMLCVCVRCCGAKSAAAGAVWKEKKTNVDAAVEHIHFCISLTRPLFSLQKTSSGEVKLAYCGRHIIVA